jgi:homeobox protein cut-like
MLTAQRDRFKKRNADLETSLAKADKTITTLRSEVTSLQKDNLDLYEKTRYISSYNTTTNRSATSASSYAANPNPSTVAMPAGASAATAGGTDRYQATYEANLSPFAAFRGRESARAVRRMHVVERAVLRVTKLVLSTRASRNATAGYLLALHVLLFWNLVAWIGGAGTAVGPAVNEPGKIWID